MTWRTSRPHQIGPEQLSRKQPPRAVFLMELKAHLHCLIG
ncbi:MAG: hypothetical protein K0R67_1525, partial [Paenibacillus sp.]|nr:hypothetical protein [Paenibacillus sp.]